MAEWVMFGSFPDATHYVDPSTIRKKGNFVKMWFLYDYKTYAELEGVKFKSMRGQKKFDCNEEQS
jgi:hypothetical protein